MAISRRLRYEVLRRDSYTCRYCGAKAPDVKLNVDAVVPEALGGSHKDPSNLTTACEACNGGKTSSSPDAPLVAAVSEDALRWAAAMRQAQTQMLAEMAGRREVYSKFDDWWGDWTYSKDNLPMPRPGGWESSIDAFLAAGLPLDVLEWCVRKAMASKTAPEATWKYMCGIAWRKINELQEAARQVAGSAASGQTAKDRPADPHLAGMVDMANKLLASLSDEERREALEWMDDREFCKAHDEPVKSDDELVIAAAEHVFESCQIAQYRLENRVTKALKQLPGGIGESAMRDARTLLFDNYGTGFSRDMFVGLALAYLEDEIAYPEAEVTLQGLPDEASAEWIALAVETYSDRLLSDKGTAVRAAARARSGRRMSQDRDKCKGSSRYTPVCLEPLAYFARIAGQECCEKGEHEGHAVCERHLEQLVEGTFASPDGKTFTATDFTEYKQPEDAWAPF